MCKRTIGAALLLLSLGGIVFGASLNAYRTHYGWGDYFPPQSLGYAAFTNLTARTNGGSAYLFSPGAPDESTVSNATRRADFWLRDVRGMTSVSACQQGGSPGDVPGTLLTRRHVYFRGHSNGLPGPDSEGERVENTNRYAIWFLGTNSVVHRAEVTNRLVTVTNGMDYTIGILDGDVPGDVETMQLATNWSGRFPASHLPLVNFCQHRIVTGSWSGLPLTVPGAGHAVVGGDSGSPNGFIVGGEFWMIAGLTTSGFTPHMQGTVDLLTLAAGLDTNSYQCVVTNADAWPTYPMP